MPHLIFPERIAARPSGSLRLDLGHPLAEGLFFFLSLHRPGFYRDEVSRTFPDAGTYPTLAANGGHYSRSLAVSGVKFTSANSEYLRWPMPSVSPTSFMLAAGLVGPRPAANGCAISLDMGSGTDRSRYMLAAGGTANYAYQYNSTGAIGSAGNTAVTHTRLLAFFLTSGASRALYGVRSTLGTQTLTRTATAPQKITVGATYDGAAATTFFGGGLEYVAAFSTSLAAASPDFAYAFNENPWQIFRRAVPRTYFFPSGGGSWTLAVADAAHAHSVDSLTLSQANTLTVADAPHAHTADNVALTQSHVLAVAEALHSHGAESPTLTQANTLAVADTLHAHSAESPSLTQANALAVADATHAHTADTLALVQAHILAVADALHGHDADNVTLSVAGTLGVAEATHAHTSESVALTQANVLVVQESTHGHTVESLTLSYGLTLAIAAALHAHAADSVALTQAHILTVQDALHSHAVDAPVLTQANVLIVSDALHAHLAELVTLRMPGAIGASTLFVVQAADRLIVVARQPRLITVHL